jgi:hypothetical protein
MRLIALAMPSSSRPMELSILKAHVVKVPATMNGTDRRGSTNL